LLEHFFGSVVADADFPLPDRIRDCSRRVGSSLKLCGGSAQTTRLHFTAPVKGQTSRECGRNATYFEPSIVSCKALAQFHLLCQGQPPRVAFRC